MNEESFVIVSQVPEALFIFLHYILSESVVQISWIVLIGLQIIDSIFCSYDFTVESTQ